MATFFGSLTPKPQLKANQISLPAQSSGETIYEPRVVFIIFVCSLARMFGWLKRIFGPSDDELLDGLGLGPNSVRIYSIYSVDQSHFDLVLPELMSDSGEHMGTDPRGNLVFCVNAGDKRFIVIAEMGANHGLGAAMIVKSLDLVDNSDDERSLLDSMDLVR